MKRKLYILHAILSAIIFFSFIGSAIGGEKSVIVGFHQKPGPNEHALIHGAKGIIKRTYHLIPAMAVTISEQEIEKIKRDKNVAYVEDDAIVMAVEPLIGAEYENSWGVLHIGSDLVHVSGNKGAGVKIGVLDTGIDYTHEDLSGNYKGGYNFVEYMCPNDPNQVCTDPLNTADDSWNSHGTHVSGIIAARQNGTGVVGVAPEADLYAVKVLAGSGGGYVSWLISGIEWAMANQMDIINLSLEVYENSQALKDACDSAYNAGVLLVAAAGNTINGGPVLYPAAYDSVIAVTGTDTSDMSAWFSPVGPEVELAAPGVNIMSTVRGGGYDYLSGTSQAAPHVTGTAALIISSGIEDKNGDGKIADDVRQQLQLTAKDLGDVGEDDFYGYGLVDAAKATLQTNGQVNFTLKRTSGSPANDAVTIPLSDAMYEITIQNNGLKKVAIDVFKGNAYLRKISTSYSFSGNKPQVVTFYLDTTGKAYNVVFTPSGKTGASADITIEKN